MSYPFKTLAMVGFILLHGCSPKYTSEEQEVLNTLNAMFDAMTAHNMDRSKELLVADGQYHNFNQQKGTLSTAKFSDYVTSLDDKTTNYKEHLSEPIHIVVQGNVASITSHYRFYRDDNFSHCGDEVFTFLKQNNKWVITGSVYTVEEHHCE